MKTLINIIIGIFLMASIAEGQGPQWRVYTPHNSELPGLPVSSLAWDQKNNCIWMCAEGSIAKFNWSNWSIYDTTNSPLPYTTYKTIALDKNNNKWFGSITAGVFYYNDTTWNHYDTSNSPLPSQWIWEIYIDEYNTKWIGTGFRGLVKFNDSTWTIYNEENSGIPGRRIRALNSEGYTKWIGTELKGLGKFNDTSWVTFNTTNSGLSYNDVTDIDVDSMGNKWISMFGGGLNRFNTVDSIWTPYLGQGFINCLVIDEARNIKWIGSPGGGLYKFYNDSILTNYRPENSPMPSYTVNDLSLDSSGNLWIATNGGLAVFNETGIVGVNDPAIINVPISAKLFQNYPNPFNPSTKIKYELVKNSNVKLSIIDLTGRVIQILVNENQKIGEYEISFEGRQLPSGAYLYKLETDDFNESRVMVLIK